MTITIIEHPLQFVLAVT